MCFGMLAPKIHPRVGDVLVPGLRAPARAPVFTNGINSISGVNIPVGVLNLGDTRPVWGAERFAVGPAALSGQIVSAGRFV